MALAKPTRERLRDQARIERDLAARVITARNRLTNVVERRDAVVAEQNTIVDAHRDEVGDALIAYLGGAGVSVERAAIILDSPANELASLIRRRRAGLRARDGDATPEQPRQD